MTERVVTIIFSEERLSFSVEDFLALTKAVNKDGTLQALAVLPSPQVV